MDNIEVVLVSQKNCKPCTPVRTAMEQNKAYRPEVKRHVLDWHAVCNDSTHRFHADIVQQTRSTPCLLFYKNGTLVNVIKDSAAMPRNRLQWESVFTSL